MLMGKTLGEHEGILVIRDDRKPMSAADYRRFKILLRKVCRDPGKAGDIHMIFHVWKNDTIEGASLRFRQLWLACYDKLYRKPRRRQKASGITPSPRRR